MINEYSWGLDVLAHHGILGQKWGVRRYQNADGTLTAAGQRHLSSDLVKSHKQANKRYMKNNNISYGDNLKDFRSKYKKAAESVTTDKDKKKLESLQKRVNKNEKRYEDNGDYADKVYKDEHDAIYKEYESYCKNITNKMLGSYGNTKTNIIGTSGSGKYINESISELVSDDMLQQTLSEATMNYFDYRKNAS